MKLSYLCIIKLIINVMYKLKYTDLYSGRFIVFRCKRAPVHDEAMDDYDYLCCLSDYQIKRLESFFGCPLCYYTIPELI